MVQRLQGTRITLSSQQSELEQLVLNLKRRVFVEGTFIGEAFDAFDRSTYIIVGSWAFEKDHVAGFLQDREFFVVQQFRRFSNFEIDHICLIVAELFVSILDGLLKTVSVRDGLNSPVFADLPPILPQDVVTLKSRQIGELIHIHNQRLSSTFDSVKIESIQQQHKRLLEAYDCEPRLKSAISKLVATSDFGESWTIPGLKDRFPDLILFLGGLAFPFPNTETLESDFSF